MWLMWNASEAQMHYNLNKIRCDPTAYSLRDRLVFENGACNRAPAFIDTEVEECLMDKAELEIKVSHRWIDITEGKVIPSTPASVLAIKTDNLYVDTKVLNKKFKYTPSQVFTHGLMDALLQMFVLLTSKKSCSVELYWQQYLNTYTLEYEQVHDLKFIQENLGKTPIPMAPRRFYDYVMYPICEYIDTSIDHDYEASAYTNCFKTLLYGLEVLWAYEHMKDAHLKSLIGDFLAKEYSPRSILRLLYTVSGTCITIPSEIQVLISVENPMERYEQYRTWINSDSIYELCHKYAEYMVHKHPDSYVDLGFYYMLTFAIDYSSMTNRIELTRIVYDYYLKNKPPVDKDTDEDDYRESSKMTGAVEDMLGMASTPEKKEVRDRSIELRLDDDCKSYPKGVPGVTSTNYTFEALDKTAAKYRDSIYTFDVSDKFNNSPEYRELYNSIADKISLVNRNLTRKIREIKTYNTGGKQPGKTTGKLDRKNLYKHKYDSHIFYDNTYKQKESDLAFGIILDCSGSMCGRGIRDGRITMIVLHETLKALGINHCIIGHTSDGNYHTVIERYQSFREDKTYRTVKNYALAKLEAQRGNCDSGSLYYMEHALKRVKNQDKICLIFSDGQPTECTGTDLREQVKKMERQGVKVIGIGIDFPEIADYYGTYANGKNLPEMLKIVTDILQEYILKKKED